jgi:tellurite resistance protein TehA-like permease
MKIKKTILIDNHIQSRPFCFCHICFHIFSFFFFCIYVVTHHRLLSYSNEKKKVKEGWKENSHLYIKSNEMISKVVFIVLCVFVVLNTIYGQHRYRKYKTTSKMEKNTTNFSTNHQDDYYDYYDYDVSYGYEQKINKTFLYCFSLMIIFVFY